MCDYWNAPFDSQERVVMSGMYRILAWWSRNSLSSLRSGRCSLVVVFLEVAVALPAVGFDSGFKLTQIAIEDVCILCEREMRDGMAQCSSPYLEGWVDERLNGVEDSGDDRDT